MIAGRGEPDAVQPVRALLLGITWRWARARDVERFGGVADSEHAVAGRPGHGNESSLFPPGPEYIDPGFRARSGRGVDIARHVERHAVDAAPLVTKVGELYVGRLPVYERGVANIEFAIDKMKKIQPNADYDHLTMVGHSNGGDISMYFAKVHPEQVKKIVTLDNLRVPFLTDGKFKILSFRSKDPVFKADPGVVPDDDTCEQAGITVVNTGFQHTDMSDRGPDNVKESIQGVLDKFLSDDSSDKLAPVNTDKIVVPKPTGPLAQAPGSR